MKTYIWMVFNFPNINWIVIMSRKLYGLYKNLDILKLIDRENKYLHNYYLIRLCVLKSLYSAPTTRKSLIQYGPA